MVRNLIAAMAFLMLVIAPVSVSQYVKYFWEKDEKIDYLGAAESQRAAGNYEAALSIYDFVFQARIDGYETARARGESIRAEMGTFLYQAKNFAGGFVTGKVEGPDSLAGCLLGDLCVWGDIRDVAKNSFNLATGGEVDRINLLLSSIGLATTLAPHVDAGISILKIVSKSMTAGMRKALLFTLEEAAKLNKYEKVNEITGTVGRIYQKVGGAVTVVIRYAKDSRELMAASRLVEKFGKSVTTYVLLGGEKAFRFLMEYGAALYRTGVKSGPRTLAFVLEHPATAARLIKVLKKVGIDHISVTAMAALGLVAKIPTFYIFLACLALWAYLFRSMICGYLIALAGRAMSKFSRAEAREK